MWSGDAGALRRQDPALLHEQSRCALRAALPATRASRRQGVFRDRAAARPSPAPSLLQAVRDARIALTQGGLRPSLHGLRFLAAGSIHHNAAATRLPWSIARLASSSAATSAPPITCTVTPAARRSSARGRCGSCPAQTTT